MLAIYLSSLLLFATVVNTESGDPTTNVSATRASTTSFYKIFSKKTKRSAKQRGFVPLFDGKTLDGWVGAKTAYYVDQGTLICRKKTHGNLFTAKEYDNFILQFEFLLTPGANNGLAIRSPLKGDAAYVGIELQILDNSADVYKDLQPYQYHGSAYGMAPARRGFLKPTGQWNRQEVHCLNRRITVILNGIRILDTDLDQIAPNGKTVDGKEHPGRTRPKGHIGFLGHGHQVRFRNIQIREQATNTKKIRAPRIRSDKHFEIPLIRNN